MLKKYYDANWEERLPALVLNSRDKVYGPKPNARATVKKRTEVYHDNDGNLVLCRHFYTHGDATVTLIVTYLRDGDVEYTAA